MTTLRRLARLEKTRALSLTAAPLSRYALDPLAYVREVLGRDLWAVQQEIARKLREPPYKVLVKSAHSTGKTFLGACLVNWWFDAFNPSCVISTAPTHRDVCDLLWQEVRLLRGQRGGFVGRTAPELQGGPDHFAKGFTASKGESFQGRHRRRMLFLFDEAVGISQVFWTTTRSMFKPDGEHGWVCFFNPTDSSSQAHTEEIKGGWHVVTMSALDHPNIAAALAGQPAPFPAAVSLGQVEDWIRDWCEPIGAEDAQVTDFEWPPGSGKWQRPGPLAEARMLGRWPSQAAYSVWSDALWQAVLATRYEVKVDWPVQLGVDVARYGDDSTAIHVRKGLCSLHHETHNGWAPPRTAGRCKQLCHQYRDAHNPEKRIPVLIDVGGVGAGVVDVADDYNFIGINSSEVGEWPERFRNVRSELWFSAQALARERAIDVSRLGAQSRNELGRQLLAVRYEVKPAGWQEVEPKDETKKLLKCSPDQADAFNLAYYPLRQVNETVAGNVNT